MVADKKFAGNVREELDDDAAYMALHRLTPSTANVANGGFESLGGDQAGKGPKQLLNAGSGVGFKGLAEVAAAAGRQVHVGNPPDGSKLGITLAQGTSITDVRLKASPNSIASQINPTITGLQLLKVGVGLSRIVVSEREVPNLLVDLRNLV